MRATNATDLEQRDDLAAPHDKRERGRGQALVEFAIILPVFFLVVAGMFDFGLGIYSDLTLVNAAREGARLGVIDPGNTAAVEQRVREMAGNLDAAKLNVTVACERPTGGSLHRLHQPHVAARRRHQGDRRLQVLGLLPRPLRHRDPALVRVEDAHRVAPSASLRHGVPPRGSEPTPRRAGPPPRLAASHEGRST